MSAPRGDDAVNDRAMNDRAVNDRAVTDEAVNDIEGTDEATETLVALIRAAFPHEGVPESAYRRAAATVQESADATAWMRVKLAQGLDSLQALAGGAFTDLSPAEALPLLLRVQHTTFFGFVRQSVVVSLYEDEEVWEVLGYEGPSFDKGGYLHRGFDDLDWLPDPRIEEYDGEPLQHVVSDLPRSATTTSVRGAAVPAGQSKVRAGRTGTGKGRA
ncbi:hypothetical protein [Brachybacterium aquaticum]|uniref:Uncharacterized protein n=1 Tax=Brachybacterium aquaticum TaxID=1432564 RepID=A0A841A6H1_9MICO|nr:hypothetical protein [Brachybacterium aquaticum]MBB5830769.1 hypothetical protein [Brachybacterium aquaticum]